MKRIILLAVCCIGQLLVMAQSAPDVRTSSTKIADLLAQQPAKDAGGLTTNMAAMSRLGEADIVHMATMLSTAGKGDNTALEYALGGYARYVTQPGQEAARATAVRAFCKALGQVADKENKTFIITLLQQAGTAAAVATLQPYLTDERLCDPVARALVKIHTPDAQAALLQALPKVSGRNQQILVEAVGDARIAAAGPVLLSLLPAGDPMLEKTVLYALAHIATPAAGVVLSKAATKAGYGYDVTNAVASYLHYAQQLAADGKQQEAIKIAQQLHTNSKGQVHVRTAALYLLTQLQGERSLPLLQAAASDAAPAYREAALKYAGTQLTPAAVAAWIKQLPKAPAAAKAAIISMLGAQHVAAAYPAIEASLKDGAVATRIAAIKAAGQTGGTRAVGPLLSLLAQGDAATIAAVQAALKTIPGEAVVQQSGALLGQVPPAAQVALIDVLASRKASSMVQPVLALAGAADGQVRTAALQQLDQLVTSQELPALYSLLAAATQPEDIKALQAAVIAAAGTDATPVLSQLGDVPAPLQSRYYPVLAGLGGTRALEAVTAATVKGGPEQQQAALRALTDWKDLRAANSLLQIARTQSGNRQTALSGYVRLAKAAGTPVQRLLMLTEAMSLTPDAGIKKNILRQAAECKTLPGLVFAGRYLDDAAVQQEAALAVMSIALADKSYNGAMVRTLLEKAAQVLKGGDADYQREAIRKYLSEMPAGEGFIPLFNERDLSGWKGLVADPPKRARMDVKALQQAQQVADTKMREGWSVKDGLLVFNGHGDNLCTQKQYGDFELFVDWKITKDGDAGIYLRGTPQVQIWDTSRRDVGAEVGSGGLYNNQQNVSKPLKLADNAIGEWNNFHIVMKGDRVTVYLNGELVVNNVMMENYWERQLPIPAREQLELQAHGTYVAYRNLYIREFEAVQPYVLSEQEKREGYQLLFDGTNMHAWTGNTSGYVVDNGDILCNPKHGGGGNLYTKDEYADFIYRFEFQLTPGANNGLGIRTPLTGDAAYQGMELQILDNEADIYKQLAPYQYHGSVYGVLPAKRGFLKPVGEWNQEEVTVKGTHIRVVLNGTEILSGDIAAARDNGTMDHKDHPGLKRPTGHIGFLGHGSVVRFRHIRIKDLSGRK